MLELEHILKSHALRYPAMEPTDVVKLIYQNEFGGGHLIRDEQAVLNYLRMEYDRVKKDLSMPKFEPIGNGIVRVFLAPLSEAELESLGWEFLRSARDHKGDLQRFIEKLSLLRELTRKGIFSFSEDDLDRYLADYEKAGYPMVSHSEAYRNAYHPAYRIILDRGHTHE